MSRNPIVGMEIPRDRLLGIRDFMTIAGISRATVYRMIRTGRAPKVVRVTASGIRFRPRDVETWLRDRTEL